MAKLSQLQKSKNISKHNTNTNNNSLNAAAPENGNGIIKPKRTRKTIPRDSPPQRSSIYRGVTRHRWTGRYEAHLWDKNCWNEAQNKKGRQVYLGAYDDEEAAAHAYDLAALKYWGEDTILNFPLSTYQKEIIEMDGQSREGYIGSLRRKSSGFSRGVSKYRGVARHHQNGRWEARIGRVFGNKYLYLGTYATQEEAAIAYDMAAIEYRGLNAVTNFDLSRYIKWLKPNNNITDLDKAININIDIESKYSLPSSNPTTLSGPHLLQQSPDTSTGIASLSNYPRPTSATSALGLLLQSTKFKEMMEMTLAADQCPASSLQDQLELDQTQGGFPDDIKIYFGSNDFSAYNDIEQGSGDHDIFGGLNSFMQPMLQFDSMLNGEDLMQAIN